MSGFAYQSARIVNARLRNLKNLGLNLLDRPVVVLGYHRVASTATDRTSLTVSPENFRAQMEYLKRNFRIVRFEEDWTTVRKPAVAVTFDDGYVDNFRGALPILKDLGVPATFFISTGVLGEGKRFWWDELERMVLTDANVPSRFELEDGRHGRCWNTAAEEERETMFRDLLGLMMKVDSEQRAEWFSQLSNWSGAVDVGGGARASRPMTRDELVQFADSEWVTIGAHTVTHSALSVLPEEKQRFEIFSSKQVLESLLGRKITTFSYPFGRRKDYDPTTIRLCREAGYRKAATAFPGHVYRWTDPFQIPRHFIQNWDLNSFIVKMKSLWI
jgi:peptidoglycan/xylan/chitin deacetylase (PgdA/CDA1 family)